MKHGSIFLLWLAPLIGQAQDTWKDVYSEKAWVDRDRWQKPDELIRYLQARSGSKVADLGCHEGYMTVKLAAAVGATGTVYAVDIEETKLERLKKILADRGIPNVEAVKGDDANPHLPANALDAVLILDTYHEMGQHDEILKQIKIALKPGGRLVLCEAIADSRRKSTREEQERKHELALTYALQDVKKAGFTIVYQADRFVDRTAEKGDFMWVLVVKK